MYTLNENLNLLDTAEFPKYRTHNANIGNNIPNNRYNSMSISSISQPLFNSRSSNSWTYFFGTTAIFGSYSSTTSYPHNSFCNGIFNNTDILCNDFYFISVCIIIIHFPNFSHHRRFYKELL